MKVGFAWRPDPTALRLVLSHQNTRSLLSVPLEMLPILPTDIINRYLFIHGHGGLTDPLCTFLLCILIELMPDVKRFCEHSFAKLSCLLLVKVHRLGQIMIATWSYAPQIVVKGHQFIISKVDMVCLQLLYNGLLLLCFFWELLIRLLDCFLIHLHDLILR